MKLVLLLISTSLFGVYPNNLKSWNLGKETPPNFCPEQTTNLGVPADASSEGVGAIAERQGAREDVNFGVKPTPPTTNFSSCLDIDSAVTYEFSGGRFGDNLLSYLHAKWISYTHQIPVLYKPFPLSNELSLDDREALYTHSQRRGRRHIGQGIDPRRAYLYICPYFPEDEIEKSEYFYFDVDWENEHFRAECLDFIAPKGSLQLTKLQENAINIAIHVREGGGFDHDDMKQKFPNKLPPLEFYTNGLEAVLKLLPGKPIYCHIFTDARLPQLILGSFKAAFPTIKFGCRQGFNHFNRNVLEDFFSLFQFDILIRPQSNFSIIPSLLHDFAIVHTPYGTKTNEILYRKLFE